mgnify:CR=1 FL=1
MQKIIFLEYEYKVKGKISLLDDASIDKVKELCLKNINRRSSESIQDFEITKREDYNYERI